MTTAGLVELIGAVALLLWGLRMVGTGVTRAFGSGVRDLIRRGIGNRFGALAAGLGATVLLQSSTATCLLTASFATRGMLVTAMALAVMLGADVGTALVAQLLTLDMHILSPLLVLVGVVLFRTGEGGRRRAIARILIGLGLMLLALRLMNGATAPLRTSPTMGLVLQALDETPALALLLAAGLAVLAYSSLATVLLIASLADGGTTSPVLAAALVLGANLGGAMPALIATLGQPPVARRVPVGNALVRLAGCVIALPLLSRLVPLLAPLGGDAGQQAILFHLAFNAALAVLFLPLVDPLARLATRLLPDAAAGENPKQPRHLDETALDTPAVAIGCATRETLRLGDAVETMLSQSLEVLRRDDAKLMDEVVRMDNIVDALHEAIKLYLARLSRSQMDDADSRRAADIMTFVINLEHVGDIIDRNMMELAAKKIKNKLRFSPEGFADISALHQRTVENLRLALSVFLSGDRKAARQLIAEKAEIRELERAASERHIDRLREGRQESIETSALHLDLLRDLKRINAHVASVAYPILNDELESSRLRPAS